MPNGVGDSLAHWLHAAVAQVLHVLCGVAEYDELPVRHNEDKINTSLAGEVRWPTDARSADDPHTKANLLLQVFRLPPPLPIPACIVLFMLYTLHPEGCQGT